MTSVAESKYIVKDLGLAEQGKKNIEWAFRDMPVMQRIKERFQIEQPFKNLKVVSCIHVTKETAVLCIVLKSGGADVTLVASNPLSTQDDVAAALVKYYDIPTFAVAGESYREYKENIRTALRQNPDVIVDDGCDAVAMLHEEFPQLVDKLIGVTENTTTGIQRLLALENSANLRVPAVGVNTSMTKHLYDNRYGTGQSSLDGIFRGTNILLAGKTVVVCGYGWCGRGCASRAKGMGANVIVTEVDPLKALEAAMEGYRVMPIAKAALEGDVFLTVTGDKHVIDIEHIKSMKDGAFLANAGHFDCEINMLKLKEFALEVNSIRPGLDGYLLENGKTVYVLADGGLVNLACAEGHPASVMDMSFANQALGAEFLVKNYGKLQNRLYTLPKEIDLKIAELKLASMGIEIDTLTEEQKAYINAWKL